MYGALRCLASGGTGPNETLSPYAWYVGESTLIVICLLSCWCMLCVCCSVVCCMFWKCCCCCTIC